MSGDCRQVDELNGFGGGSGGGLPLSLAAHSAFASRRAWTRVGQIPRSDRPVQPRKSTKSTWLSPGFVRNRLRRSLHWLLRPTKLALQTASCQVPNRSPRDRPTTCSAMTLLGYLFCVENKRVYIAFELSQMLPTKWGTDCCIILCAVYSSQQEY